MPDPSSAGALDEARIARAVTIGLPVVTIVAAGIVGVTIGPATSILVVTAGLMIGVIGLFWGSIRILTGDAPLSPEIEALDMSSHGADPLSSRKTMLLRALKDLETERSLGKLEEEDYEQISSTYREELKLVLKGIDESLAPFREKAQSAVRAHLEKAGLGRDESPEPPRTAKRAGSAKKSRSQTSSTEAPRKECPQCRSLNDHDAKFCKECAAKLAPSAASSPESSREDVPTDQPSETNEDE